MYDIVICIIHHSRIDLTIECLKSISESRLKIKICVIDNNPKERIKDIIEKKYSYVDIIVNSTSKGFAFNQNMIMNKYKGKYLSFMSLNNDTIVKKNAIFHLFNFLFKYENIGAVCPQMLDNKNNFHASLGPIPNATTHILRILNIKRILSLKILMKILYKNITFLPTFLKDYLLAKKGYKSTLQIPRISGACVLFKNTAVKDVGCYDERFYMYSEDSDWSIRAKKKNFIFYLVASAKVIHIVGASGSNTTKYELEKSMFLFIAKHQVRFKRSTLMLIALLLICKHTYNYISSSIISKSIEEKILNKNLILLGLQKLIKPI